jgi:hypothetical protein
MLKHELVVLLEKESKGDPKASLQPNKMFSAGLNVCSIFVKPLSRIKVGTHIVLREPFH